MKPNFILITDGYKLSHYEQYPEGTFQIQSYIEARGGSDKSVFFGMQAFIKEYLEGQVLEQWMIDEARKVITDYGLKFNEDWQKILDIYDGCIPIKIRAVQDGTVMETSNVQAIISNTDSKFPWLVSHVETMALRAIWYPSTVATESRKMKEIIWSALMISSDDPDGELPFKLHDFGARGVSSHESAGLGGMAHLVNFLGTDTLEGLMAAKKYYGDTATAFSIPASEHSTITSWGKDGELDAFKNMLNKYPTGIMACVSDSYDIWNAVDVFWGQELKERILKRDGVLVVRPDSGDPVMTPIKVIKKLMDAFGYTYNSKGFKVLPDQVRVIQGDGIGPKELGEICKYLMEDNISVSNIAFGMGGGLLQKVDRDNLKYAMKASNISYVENGVHKQRAVFKDPIAGGKKSKSGVLDLYKNANGEYCTTNNVIRLDSELKLALVNGFMADSYKSSFEEVRERAKI